MMHSIALKGFSAITPTILSPHQAHFIFQTLNVAETDSNCWENE